MTIDRIKGFIAFTCDGKDCHEGIETGEKDFGTARVMMRSEGWIARKNTSDEWEHFCSPECAETAK